MVDPLPLLAFSCLLLHLSCAATSAGQVETRSFAIPNGQSLTTPQDLGSFPHDCVGNIGLCDNGFTVGFWYKALAGDPDLPERYILSSGGQSAMSEGFYAVQHYGKDYEVGVAKGNQLWTVRLFLHEDALVYFVLTWSEQGLDVYIDGILAGADAKGKTRVFTAPAYDPFPQIVAGYANDRSYAGKTINEHIVNVTHWSVYYHQEEVEHLQGEAPKDLYKRGCVATLPDGVDEGVNVKDVDTKGVYDKVAKCRRKCAEKKAYVAFMKDGELCYCFIEGFTVDFLEGLSTSASCSDYEVFWVKSHEAEPDYPIDLEVEVILPTQHPYIRPEETVTFKGTFETDEYVTFDYEFGDGTNKTSKNPVVSHSWETEGSYLVKITATTRLMSETVLKRINITWVEEGIAPEQVLVKMTPKDTSVVEFDLTTIGKYEAECTLEFGDGQSEEVSTKEYIEQLSLNHEYKNPGFYDVVYSCENEYGVTADQGHAYAVKHDLEFQNEPRFKDVSVQVVGADSHKDVFGLTLNGVPVAVNATHDNVIIQADKFLYSGEHIVEVMAEDVEMRHRIFNIEEKIEKVVILTNNSQVLPEEEIHFTFQIFKGDHIHVLIEYGDGASERVYIPKGGQPAAITRAHKYATLNHYKVKVTAVNYISKVIKQHDISIERPLMSAIMSAQNVTVVDTETTITIMVDEHSAATPVDVSFDFGDGKTETVRLGKHQAQAKPLSYTHIYNEYGIYTIYAIIKNNISELAVEALHQVGENITMLDLYANRYRLLDGEEINITMDAPYGYPLVYNLDLGDGTTITVRRPVGYIGAFESDEIATTTGKTYYPPDLTVTEVIKTENSTAIMLDRQKRDINIMPTTVIVPGEGEVLAVLSTPAPMTADNEKVSSASTRGQRNEKIVVTYRYSRSGTFSVQASVENPFGGETTFLCPDIVVLPANQKQPDCAGITVAVQNATTKAAPIVIRRSKSISIPTTVKLNCQKDASKYQIDYTWKASRHIMDDLWRPELEVCHSQVPKSGLVIPGNTLWYGLYRIKVIAGVRVIEQTRVRRSTNSTKGVSNSILNSQPSLITAEKDVFLKVEKTPLVAQLRNSSKKLDVFSNNVVTIAAGSSYDPDVDGRNSNKTGMTGAIVCYPSSKDDKMKKLSSKQLLQQATLIQNNSRSTVSLYDTECFANDTNIQMLGWDVTFFGSMLIKDTDLTFRLFVWKDDREATTSQIVKVLQDLDEDNLFANLDNLLNSGDTSAALYVLGHFTAGLNGDDGGNTDKNDTNVKNERSELRGKLIGVIGRVAEQVGNFDQLSMTTDVLSSVTEVRDEVTEDSKASAADAMASGATKTGNLTADAPLDQVAGLAGGMVGVAGNVLPFADEEEETVVETIPTTSGVTTIKYTTVATKTLATTIKPPSNFEPTTQTSVTTAYVPTTAAPTIAAMENDTILVNGTWVIATPMTTMVSTMVVPSVTTVTIRTPKETVTNSRVTSYRTQQVTTTTVAYTTTAPPTEATTQNIIANLKTTMPPGLADADAVQEEEIPPCCASKAGLCEWVEPACEFLSEDDRKKKVWDDAMCNALHPDDLKEIAWRFGLYKAQQKRMLFARRKRTTQGAMGAVDSVGTSVLGKADKNTNISISTPRMKMELAKVEPGKNGSMNGIAFPSSALGDTEGAGAASMESDNAFTYSDSSKSVKGKVKSLAFKDKDGNEIKMNGTAEPFVIWMDGPGDSFPAPKQATFETSTQVLKFNYHTINTTYNDSSIHFMVRPRSPHDVYEVFIKWENFTLMNSSKENGNVGFPNETWYDHKGIVPNDLAPESEDPIVNDLLRYTYFPPPEVTRLNGTYRVGVRLLETKLSFAHGPAKNNYTYSYNSFVSGCRYWDEEADSWASAGCVVGNETSIYRTQCLCNHLTSFGSDFVVPPNTIDFSTVFSLENFIEAIPVFVTVGLVLILYLLIVVWARRADKKDVIRWGAQPLEDNLPSDKYHYQVTVYTGANKHSETTSRVSLIVSGDDGDTGVRRLWDGKRKELERASINNYILSTEGCLGPLTFLRIWHDNTGSGKKRSWFMDQVQVKDLQTGELFCFLCDRWLAVEEDDGLVERIIPVAGMREMTAFKHLFSSSVRKKLANDHLWVSVVKRPTRSNFTRVQRVSACAALLFLTMISNCMFFKSDENKENVRAITIGPIQFTLHQLFISIMTTCIVFPPSMIIITIFRRVKPKSNGVMQANQKFSQKTSKFKWRRYNPGSSLWDNQPSRGQRMKESLRSILSHHQKNKYQDDDNLDELGLPKKKKPWMLPHWCIYIAWIMCLTAIFASAFFTVLYSMQWGRKKSLNWLSTFVLSFFQSVIVVQPVKVLLLAAFLSCVMRKPDLDNEDEVFDECHNALPGPDESMDKASARNIDDILIQRKSAVTHMQPPDMASLEEARQLRMKEIAMEAILKECIVYFFFILVVFFLSYQARDSDSYLFAANIKNQFVHGSVPLNSISKPDTVWTYLRKTVLPNMYSSNWYNGKELTDWRELLQIDDRCTIRVGVARLRLQRIKEDSCEVQKVFKPIFNHCRDNYNWMDDDTNDYLPGWVVPTAENRHRQGVIDCYSEALEFENETSLRDEESPWIYRNSFELKSAPYAGTHSMYKGGGFTFTFKRTPEATKRLLDEMEQYEWVNPNARAMFIEFTLYNGNVNLFGSVILLVEWIAGGGATVRHEVKVFRLNNYVGGFGIIVIVFEVLFLGFTVYFLIKEIGKIKKERLKYFREFWNMLELSTLILSLVVIVMYALKAIFGKVALHVLEESESGEYVNFVTIGVWDEMFTFLLAFVVYLTTVKFIKMLRFNRRMGMLGDTIRIATKDLKNFIIMFFIYFLAFCMMAYMLFGTTLGNYGSFISTVESLFSFALGSFDFHAMRAASNMGVVFFILYVFVVFIGLMGMFLTIIADAFTAVKEDTALRSNDYEIVDFILGKFKGVFGW